MNLFSPENVNNFSVSPSNYLCFQSFTLFLLVCRLITLAFFGSIGVTFLILACALPEYNKWRDFDESLSMIIQLTTLLCFTFVLDGGPSLPYCSTCQHLCQQWSRNDRTMITLRAWRWVIHERKMNLISYLSHFSCPSSWLSALYFHLSLCRSFCGWLALLWAVPAFWISSETLWSTLRCLDFSWVSSEVKFSAETFPEFCDILAFQEDHGWQI